MLYFFPGISSSEQWARWRVLIEIYTALIQSGEALSFILFLSVIFYPCLTAPPIASLTGCWRWKPAPLSRCLRSPLVFTVQCSSHDKGLHVV